MATTTIPWGDGSGDNIYLTYSSASGDQTVEVSSDANTGSARSKVVTFTAGNVTQTLTVNQDVSLPYTVLEYIQTDGTAYINTNVMPKQPLSYRVKALFVGNGVLLGKGQHNSMDGGMRVTSTMIPVIVNSSKAGFTYQYTYSILDISSKIGVEPVLYEGNFAQRNRTVKVKGENDEEWTSKTYTSSLNYSTQSTPFYLFRNNYSSNPEQCGNGTRLYYCKIYNDASYTSLLFDGIPVLYNGEYGLWDMVTNSFFGSANSGTFTGA